MEVVLRKARLYKITSPNTNKVYIGATKTGLNRRLTMHKMCYRSFLNGKQKMTTSFKILEAGEAKIELIEECRDISKRELHEKEADLMRNTIHCVNKKIECRTPKQYYQDHREMLLLKSKLRYYKKKLN